MTLDQINNFLSFLDKIQGLSAVGLVFVLCIAIGYAWRGLNLKWFPNDAIPMMVMVSGSLFMMFIADGRPHDMPHHVWTARNLAVGFVIGALAWVVHNYAITRIETWIVSKIPKLGDTTFFTKPPNPGREDNTEAGQPSGQPPKSP